MTDLRTHWMRTVHEALCGLSAKRLMLGERIIGGECATADVTCHGCRAVLRLAAMDAASGGPDDLRTLAQAYLDAREVDAVRWLTASRRVTRTGLALGAALGTPTTVPPAAHAAAILAALDAAYAQGYARAMGEVVAEVQTRTEAAVSSYYADRSSYREGYSDACDTLCELVQHMAQTRCD